MSTYLDSINDLPSIAETISKYNLRPLKSLGQNFLLNLQITEKIARVVDDITSSPIIEIGPGPGGLTRSLLKSGAPKVYAIEYDKRAIESLQPLLQAAQGRLEVIYADALEYDLQQLVLNNKAKVVANLPYNIATTLLLRWLENHHNITSFTLMFQREVAERLIALPNTPNYSRLTVIVQWFMKVKILFNLAPSIFKPIPKVTSSLIKLLPRNLNNDQLNLSASLRELLLIVFKQRRKMLRTTLKEVYPDIEQILTAQGIDSTRRPESLTLMDYEKLARSLKLKN